MKKIISFLFPFFFSFLFLFFFKFDVVHCDEYIDNYNFPEKWYYAVADSDTYDSYYSSLLENPVFSEFSDEYFISLSSSGNFLDVLIVQPDFLYDFSSSSSTYILAYGKYCYSTVPKSQLNSFNFTVHAGDLIDYNIPNSLQYSKSESDSSVEYRFGRSYFYNPSYPVMSASCLSDAVYYHKKPPYNPIISPLYEAVYSQNIDKEKFIEWLIKNGRYVEILSDLTENRLSGFVDIFQRYGANSNAFGFNIKQFFKYYGIGQTISDYNTVLNKTQSLYREYQQYVRQSLVEHFNDRTHGTSNIKPDTNSDNTSLITNSDSDTVVILILRDILRSLIALPNNISDLLNSLDVNLDSLENTVNVVNQSGVPDLSEMWIYSDSDFDVDIYNFSNDIAEIQQLPLSYLSEINNNPLMPEHMLSDKDSLSVNIPNISGFTVSDNGKSLSTETTTYTLKSDQYPWLDAVCKKIKRFSSILLIIGYLIHLRNKIPDIVRGE